MYRAMGFPNDSLTAIFIFFEFCNIFIVWHNSQTETRKKNCLPPSDILVKMTMKKKFCSLPKWCQIWMRVKMILLLHIINSKFFWLMQILAGLNQRKLLCAYTNTENEKRLMQGYRRNILLQILLIWTHIFVVDFPCTVLFSTTF